MNQKEPPTPPLPLPNTFLSNLETYLPWSTHLTLANLEPTMRACRHLLQGSNGAENRTVICPSWMPRELFSSFTRPRIFRISGVRIILLHGVSHTFLGFALYLRTMYYGLGLMAGYESSSRIWDILVDVFRDGVICDR